jgi:hypothetical protein
VNQLQPPRRRHRIPELGLSFETDPAWALDARPLDGGTIVSQRLPNDAVFFVRYGPSQTLDRFLDALGDMFTTATVIDDGPDRIAAVPARRVTVRLDRRPIPGRSAETPAMLRVIGFEMRGVPVLVGYRMREERTGEIESALEQIVESVGLKLDGDSAEAG